MDGSWHTVVMETGEAEGVEDQKYQKQQHKKRIKKDKKDKKYASEN